LGPLFKGEWNYEIDAKKLLDNRQITKEQYEQRLTIANRIQQVSKEKDLKPVLRVEYQRTGFQGSTYPDLRIYLDDDLEITKEKMEKGKWPITLTVAPKDRMEFPFSILQIKYLDKCPPWVQSLEKSPVLIPIEGHYSKFLYGVSKFYVEHLNNIGISLPRWYPTIETTHQQLKKKKAYYF